ncbi:MAG TPA: hypothetical protein VGO52_25920 [Hyphomonadaceae bacterium]|jgi:hypothetical protein|nr:hypothetical protein [Hyphomonadaceae bacterium]
MKTDRKSEGPQLERASGIDWGGVAVVVLMPVAIMLGVFFAIALMAMTSEPML